MTSEVHARAQTQREKRRGLAPKVHNRVLLSSFKRALPPLSRRFRVEWSICVERVEHSIPSHSKQRLFRTFQDAGSAGWRAPFRPRADLLPARQGMAAEEVAEFGAAHYAKAELTCSHADQVRVCTQLVLSDLLPPQPGTG